MSAFERWFRSYRPSPLGGPLLVCLPHAGGAASFFRRWALAAPDGLEVLSVQYPGREDRTMERPIDDLVVLAERIAGALGQVEGRPLALFGHSLGAVVGYEVTRRLEALGRSVAWLIVSARGAPHATRSEGRHLLDDDALWREVRRLNGTDELVLESHELRGIVLPILRGDYRLVELYQPADTAPIATPIAAFVGDRDPGVSVRAIRAWAELTRARFELNVLPGDHFYLTPQRDRVLAAVQRLLVAGVPHAGEKVVR